MSDNVTKLSDFRSTWREAFVADSDISTLQVYTNNRSGCVEIVQLNDEGETIRTILDAAKVDELIDVLTRRRVR